jgi:hypothetical protein
MKHIIAVCMIFFVVPLAVEAQEKVVVNDKNAQVRQVGSFTEISVSSSIDLYLSPDDKEVVVVSAKEEQFRDRIVTRVVGNKLEIYYNDKSFSTRTDMRLKAYVSFRQLNKISASGSSDVYVNGVVKADALEIRVNGSSDFHGAVDCNKLRVDQSGSSDTKLSGRANDVSVDLSEASDMKAFELSTETIKVHASGSSDVSVTVMKELYVSATGASDVRYKGTGTVKEVKTSGASSVQLVRD